MIYKLIISLSVLLSIALSSAGQKQTAEIITGQRADAIAPGAEMLRIKPFSDIPNYIRFREEARLPEDKAVRYLDRFSDNTLSGFVALDATRDQLGMEHKRYQQTYRGIPVEYSAYLFHLKDGQVASMNGNICSAPAVSGSFSLSKAEALEAAEMHINAEQYIYNTGESNPYRKQFEQPVPEKVYFPDDGNLYSNRFRAAWKIDIFALQPYSRHYVYVDAESGEILDKQTRIHSADVTATANTAYSGEQQITTDSYQGYYRLRESGRGDGIATYNCQDTDDYDQAVDFTNSDTYWNNVNEDLDQYATDAHFATEKTWDYFNNEHGRNSIDGNGFALESYIHFSLIDYGYDNNVNAFWNGSVMTYGDGNETISPLTTVDIAAHEITHGLTTFTCNLNYQDESGALNEAFSDIFGVTVEFYAVPSLADWTVGEDIGATFRSIADPNAYNKPDTYQGEHWVWDASDNGGVHTNMGALSYWYYLLCEGDSGTNDNGDSYNISPIGMEAAEDIAFRLQTVYLTNTSEYLDARFYGIQAAVDFYGACSSEVGVVTDAFYAIGVGNAYVPTVQADFEATYTENCEAPFTVHFENYSINGNSFVWDFGDGNTSTEVNPSHTYTSEGEYDVELYADGGSCGEDTEIKSGFVSINPDNPCLIFMPESGNSTSEQCYGTLYDAGGPNSNYPDNTDASFTIQPANASQVTLTISDFDIEAGSGSTCDYDYIAFYDGANTSAPLINDTYYCNTTGNPGTITSTGGAITIEFHSDQAVNMSGFQIDWECVQEEAPPQADFSAQNTSCTGRIQFTDQSLSLPTGWNWDFGDGNTSDEQNPEHVYATAGNYTASLEVSNAYGTDNTTQSIEVNLSSPPQVEDQTVCQDSVFLLEIPGATEYLDWFSDENCTQLQHSGNSWEHPPLSAGTEYYLREMIIQEPDTVGAGNNTSGGGFFGNEDYVHYLIFDAYQPFILNSVLVNADGAGTRSIAVRDENQNIIDATDVYIPDGVSRVELNLNVPAGEDLQLVGLGAPDLFRTSESSYVNYPYTIDNLVSITKSSAGSDLAFSYYYYFYDWEVEATPCESETAVMHIETEDCTVGFISNKRQNSISLHPNPAEDEIQLTGLENEVFPVEMTIYNAQGQTVLQQTLRAPEINISDFRDGLYFVQLTKDNRNTILKLMKK